MQGPGETRYSECRVLGRADIVNAGSGESSASALPYSRNTATGWYGC
ncbi:unnamed protein product, partial [Staurois parvus]